jgi:hypothetical protein
MKKKLSVRAAMPLALSAVLFCLPVGAFMASRANAEEVRAQVITAKGAEQETGDVTAPTLNAAVSNGILSIQAQDADSGIKAVYVNGYEFTNLTDGTLSIRLQQFDAGYQYFTISAMDNAGNMSEDYRTANPYYTDKENDDGTASSLAGQLPVSAQAANPTSATAQVTEHTATDSSGNTATETGAEGHTEKGKEFYTIQTESEKVFYLVIDRDGDDETVYFLTEISENDLLNATSDNSETLPQNSAALESAIPESETALSNNNTDSKGMEGTEQEESTEEDNEPAEQQKDRTNTGTVYIVLGIAAAGAIGGGYYLKAAKKKKEDFLDEDDEEDDENEEYEDDEEENAESEDDFFEDNEEEAE